MGAFDAFRKRAMDAGSRDEWRDWAPLEIQGGRSAVALILKDTPPLSESKARVRGDRLLLNALR